MLWVAFPIPESSKNSQVVRQFHTKPTSNPQILQCSLTALKWLGSPSIFHLSLRPNENLSKFQTFSVATSPSPRCFWKIAGMEGLAHYGENCAFWGWDRGLELFCRPMLATGVGTPKRDCLLCAWEVLVVHQLLLWHNNWACYFVWDWQAQLGFSNPRVFYKTSTFAHTAVGFVLLSQMNLRDFCNIKQCKWKQN